MFNAIKGLARRGECLCKACATSSLPVPDSPLISTVMCDWDNRPIARNTSCIAGDSPIISVDCSGTAAFVASCCCNLLRCKIARLTSANASSISKGFGKYSNAPV